jgi:mercuric ion transport protein
MKKERLASGGAVLAAFAASLCCIAPLLFVVLGLGAFGAASFFETARPYLLGAAVLFLAFGFYRTYFRRAEKCTPDGTCVVKPVNRASRLILWVASAAVLIFALSPYYAGTLARRIAPKPAAPENAPQAVNKQETFKVTGMTCAGCENTIKLALEKTSGVRSAEVSYERSEAVVAYDPKLTSSDKLREAINETGYTCELQK